MGAFTERWSPERWVDGDGMVHWPLMRVDPVRDQHRAVRLADLMEVFNQVTDQSATLVVEYHHDYQDDFWTLRYYNDQSDFYSI